MTFDHFDVFGFHTGSIVCHGRRAPSHIALYHESVSTDIYDRDEESSAILTPASSIGLLSSYRRGESVVIASEAISMALLVRPRFLTKSSEATMAQAPPSLVGQHIARVSYNEEPREHCEVASLESLDAHVVCDLLVFHDLLESHVGLKLAVRIGRRMLVVLSGCPACTFNLNINLAR